MFDRTRTGIADNAVVAVGEDVAGSAFPAECDPAVLAVVGKNTAMALFAGKIDQYVIPVQNVLFSVQCDFQIAFFDPANCYKWRKFFTFILLVSLFQGIMPGSVRIERQFQKRIIVCQIA